MSEPRRELSLRVVADTAADFAAGSFDLVSSRLTVRSSAPAGLWQRLRQPFLPRQPLETWLFGTLQQALSEHASSEVGAIGELRAPAQRTPPDVPALRTQLVLVRSHDETWAGLQLGDDAFKFRLRTLTALALIVDVEREADRRYRLRLTLSADRAEPSAPATQHNAELPIAEPEQIGTPLALLETLLQLTSFYRARFEYLGP